MKKNEFYNEVYNVVSQIPPGTVLTYGHIAKLIGKPKCARMVGQAMFNAPTVLNLPCHRVVNSQGQVASRCPEQKIRLLNEGVDFKTNKSIDLEYYLWAEVKSLKYGIDK